MESRCGGWTAALLLAVSGACSTDATEVQREAAARFSAFQEALFARDEAALRELVCRDAHPAVPGLLDADLAGRTPLEVRRIETRGPEHFVHVTEASRPDAGGFYVLTRERGALRVDLLATTRYQSRTTSHKLDRPTLVPDPRARAAAEAASRGAATPR